MEEHRDKMIEIYSEKRKQGMDFTEIRKELQIQNLSAGDISYIIRKIDDNELYALNRKRLNNGTISIKSVKWLTTVLLLAPALLIIFGYGIISIPLLVVIVIWGRFYYSNLRR